MNVREYNQLGLQEAKQGGALKAGCPDLQPKVRQRRHDSYACAYQHFEVDATCTAYGFGNLTALVNDPSLDPLRPGSEEKLAANCVVREVLVGGWAFFFMFVSVPMAPGTDLRYDYGSAFWDILRDITAYAAHEVSCSAPQAPQAGLCGRPPVAPRRCTNAVLLVHN
jgi:hypothetical protein